MHTKKAVYPIFKRGMDVIIAIVLLVIFLPMYPIVAAIIRLDSPGKALFSQLPVQKQS